VIAWRSITPSTHSAFMVKGTELSFGIVPDTCHRFGISEVRAFVMEGGELVPDRLYHVRDAQSVTDEEVRNRVRPRIVATFSSDLEALAYCASIIERAANELARSPETG
jgi:hypothetical protein